MANVEVNSIKIQMRLFEFVSNIGAHTHTHTYGSKGTISAIGLLGFDSFVRCISIMLKMMMRGKWQEYVKLQR